MESNKAGVVYKINWLRAWKNLSIYVSLSIALIIIITQLLIYITSGFNYNYTFRHVSPIEMLGLLIAICIGASILVLSAALLLTMYQISIKDEALYGRNYWMVKKKIPLNNIQSIDRFEQKGVGGFIVQGEYKKDKIFISDETEDLGILMTKLMKYHKSIRE
ncbi:MAG: hypothetical protein IPJ74_20550 [Saprospiraceae bacterium]|nr:hypothetical protein [Saprospiraceae bacterium]